MTRPGFDFILLRHGQSQWNLEKRFTGWTDIPLTELGRREAVQAAEPMKQAGFQFDAVYTSLLDRAVETLEIVLEVLHQHPLPIVQSWRLNERHYGSLQGLNKDDTARQLGAPLVVAWRRSYDARPPALEIDDHRHPRFDIRYSNIPIGLLPRSESLEDTERRLLPFWEGTILPTITSGKQVLVVAHGNSLRALVRWLDRISPHQVPGLDIPTGVPLVYRIDPGAGTYQRIGCD